MADELTEKVSAWLTQTGFPLEMRVARAVRRANPLWVEQSRNYFDATTGAVRETDVVAAWGDRDGSEKCVVILVIECKAKPAPWVVFDDGLGISDDGDLRLSWAVKRAYENEYGDSPAVVVGENAFTGQSLLKPDIVGLAAVEVTFADKSSVRNGAWDAVRSAVSAAHGVVAEIGEWSLRASHGCVVAVPIVVTSGRLFRSYLDGDQMKVEDADRLSVRVRTGAQMNETRCLVVTEAALPSIFAEAERTPGVIGFNFGE